MWTFLGIASFIYVYKKCGDLMSYANKEVLLSAVLFFSLGLLLSYRYHFRAPRQQQQQQQKPHLGMLSHALSALPLVGFFWAKPAAGSRRVEQPKSRKVCSGWTWCMGWEGLPVGALELAPERAAKEGQGGVVFASCVTDVSCSALVFDGGRNGEIL